MLNSTDKFLVNDGSVTETVTWAEIQSEANPMIVSVVFTPDEPEVDEAVSATPVTTGGQAPYTYTYQWVTADDAIGTNQTELVGATANTYTPISANTGKFLGCVVVATDDVGNTATGTGYATNAVELALVIAKPTVLTPPDGAGIGGDATYFPMTSETTFEQVAYAFDPSFNENWTYTKSNAVATSTAAVGIARANAKMGTIGVTTGTVRVQYKIDVFGTQYTGIGLVSEKTPSSTSFIGASNSIGFLSSLSAITLYNNGAGGTNLGIGHEGGVQVYLEYDFDSKRVSLLNSSAAIMTGQTWEPTDGKDVYFACGSNAGGTEQVEIANIIALQPYQLSLADNKVYNADTGEEESATLTEAFAVGTTIKGESSSPVADTPAFTAISYDGVGYNDSTPTGIDNRNKSLIWVKHRQPNASPAPVAHCVVDTVRGVEKVLATASTAGQTTLTNSVYLFNSDGFQRGTNNNVNAAASQYACWNFRAAPGFMDIVKYKGTGVAQEIPHSLESQPPFMIVKSYTPGQDFHWRVYSAQVAKTKYLNLNQDIGPRDSTTAWNSTHPTDTHFTVGTDGNTNQNGTDYIAYLFANTTGKIKHGYFDTDPAAGIDCGFKPQWIMIKKLADNTDWEIYDKARTRSNDDDKWRLIPNQNVAEPNSSNVSFTDTGFTLQGRSGQHIYLAIADGVEGGQMLPTAVVLAVPV